MSLIPVFNKTSPRAHTESELDELGVHGKVVKYVVIWVFTLKYDIGIKPWHWNEVLES
jgi:hypothetical protein